MIHARSVASWVRVASWFRVTWWVRVASWFHVASSFRVASVVERKLRHVLNLASSNSHHISISSGWVFVGSYLPMANGIHCISILSNHACWDMSLTIAFRVLVCLGGTCQDISFKLCCYEFYIGVAEMYRVWSYTIACSCNWNFVWGKLLVHSGSSELARLFKVGCMHVPYKCLPLEFWRRGVSGVHQGSGQNRPRVGAQEGELLTLHSADIHRDRGTASMWACWARRGRTLKCVACVLIYYYFYRLLSSSLTLVLPRAKTLCCIASRLLLGRTSPRGRSILCPCMPTRSLSGHGRAELESPRWEGEENTWSACLSLYLLTCGLGAAVAGLGAAIAGLGAAVASCLEQLQCCKCCYVWIKRTIASVTGFFSVYTSSHSGGCEISSFWFLMLYHF